MGKPTGFMEYKREVSVAEDPKKRIQHFNEFHEHLPKEKQRLQGARCMECGVPFCQSGMMICGMASGCPLHNLVPEWNDLVYTGNWQQAYNRLKKTNNFPEFTSRVCPALCEAACTCALNGDPVAIKDNEKMIRIRFINTARIPLRIRCVPLSFFMSYASFSLVNLLISPCAPPITRSDNTKMPTEIQLPYPILLWLKDT